MSAAPRRNPGPSWGSAFVYHASRILPGPVFRGLLWLGSGVAVALMPDRRRASAAYLARVRGRPARRTEVVTHFYTFMKTLVRLLHCSRGAPQETVYAPGQGEAFDALARSEQPMIFATFHLGHADLLGFLLGRYGRTVSMVRLQVGNSRETAWAGHRFQESVRILWVEEPQNILFAIRGVLAEGKSLALKCDRVEGARKVETFPFFGQPRYFPFTAYHLAIMYTLPLAFCFGVEGGPATTEAYCSDPFVPDAAASREKNLALGREHFAGVVASVEALLRRDPYQWFNFAAEGPGDV